MECKKCGKTIPENEKVCPNCGEDITNVSSQRTNSIFDNTFSNLINWIKMFFSNNVINGLKDVAQSNSLTGIIGLAIEILIITLAFSAFITNSTTGIFNDISGLFGSGSRGISYTISTFFSLFSKMLFISFVFIGLIYGAIFLVFKICKTKPYPMKIISVICYSLIPIVAGSTLILVFSILSLGLGAFALVLFSAAPLMTFIMLYIGIQRINKFERAPFFPFTALIWISMLILSVIIIIIMASSAVSSIKLF